MCLFNFGQNTFYSTFVVLTKLTVTPEVQIVKREPQSKIGGAIHILLQDIIGNGLFYGWLYIDQKFCVDTRYNIKYQSMHAI